MATKGVPRKDVEQLKRLQKDLRRLARKDVWDDKIRDALDRPARDAKTAVIAAIQRIPSKGGARQHGSLRASMVRAVKSNVDTTRDYTGAFVYLDAYSLPFGQQNLAAYMEGVKRYTKWRHEVFGNPTNWVQQKAHPYFYRTLRKFETETANVAERVIDAVEGTIT